MKGSVCRRSNGTWEYRFDLGPDPLRGKRRQTTKSGFATRREAEAALRTAMSQHDKGRYICPSRRTVEAFLNEWHAAVRPALRPTTWAKYRTLKDAYVIPVIGATVLQDLTPVRLNLLYGRLLAGGRVRRRAAQGAGLAPSSVVAVHRMLHRALADAVRWDYLPGNIAEDAEPPKVGRYQHWVSIPEELRSFVAHVRGDRLFALCLLVVTTGLRHGQLVGVRRHDVDLDAGTITPGVARVMGGQPGDPDPKTDSADRTLALDPVTVAALRERIAVWEAERAQFGHGTELLFCWPDGRGIHPDTVTDWFQRTARTLGLPVIRLHDVRHSYATAALRTGIHPKIVNERLGHADVTFTLRAYSHVIIPEMDRQAAATVADLILAGPDVRRSVRAEAASLLDGVPGSGGSRRGWSDPAGQPGLADGGGGGGPGWT